VEAVLQRLDRLTRDGVRITAVQTLKVFFGLTQNIKGGGQREVRLIAHINAPVLESRKAGPVIGD
jgi:hypothetical protein